MRLKFLFLSFIFFLFSSCKREFHNPLDPESPAYIPPSVEIVSPVENETINSTSVTILWFGNRPDVNEYRYRLIDYSDWSEWTNATSATFDYLDDVEYTFEIEVRYRGSTDVRRFSRKFKVDAVKGPTLKFYKLRNIVKLGNEFYISVWIEDINKFKSAGFKVDFNKDVLSFLSLQEGEFVLRSGLGQVIVPDFSLQRFIDEVNSKGEIEVTTGVFGNTSVGSSLSGSGEIIKFKFKAKEIGEGYFELKDVNVLDEDGNSVMILQTPKAYVKVR
ncbi:cohesin domain-containing protein [Candidatus Kryptobacter tengchongensis]|uniref:cohesin domain-containing protein n=1 Tax=Kryptobacter tengchongensis TaxID=1643429 RepID=UPI0007079131|nr:cohesin domain-containing protein [Candidatus Kryptobacter tengchongensis]CUS76321.1 hypothetical protein JGI20_01598 [Candidatus Kryptobacter tengchongensis]